VQQIEHHAERVLLVRRKGTSSRLTRSKVGIGACDDQGRHFTRNAIPRQGRLVSREGASNEARRLDDMLVSGELHGAAHRCVERRAGAVLAPRPALFVTHLMRS
jgi:ribosomal protein S28E/S33